MAITYSYGVAQKLIAIESADGAAVVRSRGPNLNPFSGGAGYDYVYGGQRYLEFFTFPGSRRLRTPVRIPLE